MFREVEKHHVCDSEKSVVFLEALQGSLYDQPKQCTVVREIPQNYPRFVLFDPRNMGNLMTLHPLSKSKRSKSTCWTEKKDPTKINNRDATLHWLKTWSRLRKPGHGFDFEGFLRFIGSSMEVMGRIRMVLPIGGRLHLEATGISASCHLVE